MSRGILSLILVCCPGLWASGLADDADHFRRQVQPLLERRCYECHSHRAKELQGGLSLDSRSGWAKGGDSGPAVVPGKPDESLLIKAVRRTSKDLQMPPNEKLSDDEIAVLVEWVRRGAVDPRESPDTERSVGSWPEKLAERRKHWCWQPIVKPPIPNVKQRDWPANPIDRFVLARLEAEGLSPSRDADAWPLARRLSFAVTGLPPDVTVPRPSGSGPAVENRPLPDGRGTDSAPLDHEQLVDRTLASPHFGEHWARHWMDLVRYSDTHGSEHDPLIPHAWRYRDYLVRAINGDLPYDRFVREHLAGDLLPPRWNPTLDINESPIGTGWFRFVEFYPTPIDVKNEEIVVIDAQIDSFSKTFQGLTIACARCHDHKFDAISAQDFAALYGIFASTRTTMHRVNDPVLQHSLDQSLAELKPAIRRSLAELWREQLTHWPVAILSARDKLLEPEPPKPTDKDKPAAPMPPPFVPGTRSLEAESSRWAAALRVAKLKPTEPLNVLTRLAVGHVSNVPPSEVIDAKTWTDLASERQASDRRRSATADRVRWFADFEPPNASSTSDHDGWFATDNFQTTHVAGEFAVAPSGGLLTAILPSARSSHLVSNKHGGTLRSPNFTLDMKFISVLAGGTNNARVRLVIENFVADGVLFTQVMPMLNDPRLKWITLGIREAWAGRRAYLEVIPRDEMPYPGKHPDARVLHTDGRSGVSIRAVAFHDIPGPPELSSPLPEDLWQAEPNWPALAKQMTKLASDAITAWADARCTDEQARFVDELLRSGVLLNDAPADSELARRLAQFRELESKITVPVRVAGVTDEEGFDERLFPRGNHRRAGAIVPRRYLEVLGREPVTATSKPPLPLGEGGRRPGEGVGTIDAPTSQESRNGIAATGVGGQPQSGSLTLALSQRERGPDGGILGSGRRELADAILDPRNPLTARVMVNRLWQHVFGVGLVKTVDNFGVLGESPSHPELLDWLAAEFIESGWSIKHMLRLMLTSRTFQLSSEASPAARERDPNNRLLSHANVRRLEAESLRDSLLFVSGRLDRRHEGPNVPLPLRAGIKDFENPLSGPPDGNGRRSLYLEARRNYPQHLLIAFDQPKPVLTVGERNITNVPAQSLALLNDPFVGAQSGLLAERIRSLPTPEARLQTLWRILFARPATDSEVDRTVTFLKSQAALLGITDDRWQTDQYLWHELAHALINTKEFLYLR